MSASQGIKLVVDEYLMSQQEFPQEIELNAKYRNVRIWTPVGRLTFVYLQNPRLPKADSTNQVMTFGCTILMNPTSIGQLYEAIKRVAESRFGPENRFDPATQQLRTFQPHELFNKEHGLKYPIAVGDALFNKEPAKYAAWHGVYTMNAGVPAHNKAGEIVRPPVLDEMGNPVLYDRIYSGCYGRINVTFYGFEKNGNRGIGVGLNGFQFARHGERMGNVDQEAYLVKSAQSIGPLPIVPIQPPGQMSQAPGAAPGSMPPIAGIQPPPPPPMMGAPVQTAPAAAPVQYPGAPTAAPQVPVYVPQAGGGFPVPGA